MKEIRIVILDDHALFRDGLSKLLEAEPGFQVVGRTSNDNGPAALVQRLKPDILLLGLSRPHPFGLETLRQLTSMAMPARTLVLLAAIDRTEVVEAFRLGAKGVVLKESSTGTLLAAIRAVMAGQCWIGQESLSDVVQVLSERLPPRNSHLHNFDLTPREIEVIAFIVEGNTNRNIAERCGVSQQTVKHHLTSIFNKVGVDNRLELALFAINHNLVPEAREFEPQPEATYPAERQELVPV